MPIYFAAKDAALTDAAMIDAATADAAVIDAAAIAAPLLLRLGTATTCAGALVLVCCP